VTWRPSGLHTAAVAVVPRVPFTRADRWCAALPEDAWTTIEVRNGARGPLVVQAVKTRVPTKTDRRRNGPEETLVVLRECQDGGAIKHDYHLSNASPETPLSEFARVANAEHRIEECLERANAERVRPSGQRRAPHRGMPGAGEARRGAGPVSGSQLARLPTKSLTTPVKRLHTRTSAAANLRYNPLLGA